MNPLESRLPHALRRLLPAALSLLLAVLRPAAGHGLGAQGVPSAAQQDLQAAQPPAEVAAARAARGIYLGLRLERVRDGFAVRGVEPRSAADLAGLERGDILLALDGIDAGEPEDVETLRKRLEALRPGRPVPVRIRRGSEIRTLELVPDPAIVRDGFALERALTEGRIGRYLRSLRRLRPLLEEVAAQCVPVARSAPGDHAAYEGLNDLLGRLGVSHAAVIPPWTYESLLGGGVKSEDRYHLGLYLKELEVDGTRRAFVTLLMPGGPAERGGLQVGDEICSVEGEAYLASERRILAGYEAPRSMYTLRVERGETIRLEVRSAPHAEPREVRLTAGVPLSSLRSLRASAALYETEEGTAGYVHLWDLLPNRLPSVLWSILRRDLLLARGLVVDLRGRGGQVQVLLRVAGMIKEDARPCVLLTDRETRSAKEVLARFLKGKPRVVIVGERTAGAVRPGVYTGLPSGARAMFPQSPRAVIRVTGGTDLEGRGVEPDIAVEFELPYAGGSDPIRERGLEELEKMLSTEHRLRV